MDIVNGSYDGSDIVNQINSEFTQLVGSNFITRQPNVSKTAKNDDIPEFEALSDYDKCTVHCFDSLDALLEPNDEKHAHYWSINSERFQRYIRDQAEYERLLFNDF